MKKFVLAVVGAVLFTSSAFAAGYGDAGCGLGSMLFQNQPGAVQILAATTNGTSINQAFGISSGTSNCDAKGAVMAQNDFVVNNFSGIAKEMASGQGEHLGALAGLFGCPSVKQARFNSVAQKNYAAIYANDATTPTEMLTAVKTVVAQDTELATACGL